MRICMIKLFVRFITIWQQLKVAFYQNATLLLNKKMFFIVAANIRIILLKIIIRLLFQKNMQFII